MNNLLLLGTLMLPLAPLPVDAASLHLINLDVGSGKGLDDPTPVPPANGNDGTTVGEQRRIVYSHALALWGAQLDSTVPIWVSARSTGLACGKNTVVARGGATRAVTNIGGDDPKVLYHVALANAIDGEERRPGQASISTELNGRLGEPGCMPELGWYMGLDGHTPAGQVSYLDMVLVQVARGLGFSSFVNVVSGELQLGLPDIFARRAVDSHTGQSLAWMSAARRAQLLRAPGRVVWEGPSVTAEAAFVLDRGPDGQGVGTDHLGRVKLYTPDKVMWGAGVTFPTFSTFDTSLSPRMLMQPVLGGPSRVPMDLDLTPALLQDIGWTLRPDRDDRL